MALLYFHLAFIYLISTFTVCKTTSNELPNCKAEGNPDKPEAKERRELLVVSTLDGKISALDPAEGGLLIWSQTTEPGALLSSSISNLELFNKGQAVQMIPSLDGTLYLFNGETLEPIPVTAETLLQHSFKYGDDNVITGGKETTSYGINPLTGEINYICGMSGCTTIRESVSSRDDVLLIKRHTQVLRSVDSRTGVEKWNFSVGELHTSYIQGVEKGCHSTHKLKGMDNDGHIEVVKECIWDNLQIKVFVPEGIVAAVQDSSGRPLWSHKLESPVVSLWKIRNGAIEHIDLFDPKVFSSDMSAQKNLALPLLYLGIHNNQPYIQHTSEMMKTIANSAAYASGNPFMRLESIHWKPYLVTASSRTPHIHLGNHATSTVCKKVQKTATTTALILRGDQSDYPYDSGYYLYDPWKEVLTNDNVSTCKRKDEEIEKMLQETLNGSIWDYWQQIAAISFIFAIVLNMVIYAVRKMRCRTVKEICNSSEGEILKTTSLVDSPAAVQSNMEEKLTLATKISEYTSRFLTDFNVIQCLGKGGFGVVYEAQNKIDDCSYAVKRICLPNREDAREKVRREVKALAKLDHSSIVRYYHTWLECPPPGWQEKEDKMWESSDTQSPSHISASPHIRLKNPSSPFRVQGDINESYGFTVSQLCGNNNTCIKDNCTLNADSESSFDIVFQDSANEIKSSQHRIFLEIDSSEGRNTIEVLPFKQYKKQEKSDSSFVFQDSGCGDQSSAFQKMDSSDSSTKEKCVDQKDIAKNISRPNRLDIDVPSGVKAPKVYLYIQMELCQKETMKDWLNNTTYRDRNQVLDIFDQIVGAVEYFHKEGLMHRDLKPSNIFFSKDGWVKVGDFGLVTAMAESELHTPAAALPKTDNSSPFHTNNVGTQLYMSPEQISGQAYNHKVDIFSLGIILFELLFPLGTNMERVQTLIGVKEQKFPKAFIEDYPEECALVQQLVAIDPEERPSASAIKSHPLFMQFHPHPHVPLRTGRHRTFSNRLSGSDLENFASNNDVNVCA